MVKEKPSAYSFLRELGSCVVDQVSIEAAQPSLDPAILESLPDKVVIYGVLDMDEGEIETPELVADRLRAALQYLPAERLIAAPDCGMKYMSRDTAFAKLQAMAQGAAMVREELNLR